MRNTKPLKGSVQLTPFRKLSIVAVLDTCPDDPAIIVRCPAEHMLSVLEVPTDTAVYDAQELNTVSWPGWKRALDKPFTAAKEATLRSKVPLLVAGRGRWSRQGGHLAVFGRGLLIDGAFGLVSAVRRPRESDEGLLAVVWPTMTDGEATRLREELTATDTLLHQRRCVRKPGTSRFRATMQPETLELLSDPWLAVTALGYSPAVEVRSVGQESIQHLLIGAKSLAKPLEQARQRFGTLCGLVATISKISDSRSAPYVVDVLRRNDL